MTCQPNVQWVYDPLLGGGGPNFGRKHKKSDFSGGSEQNWLSFAHENSIFSGLDRDIGNVGPDSESLVKKSQFSIM